MLDIFLSELPHTYNVIVANGEFPAVAKFLILIKNADNIISCDGATKHLLKHKIAPTIIIGDCDSLSEDIIVKFQDKIIQIADQNSNDLSKAVNWAHSKKLDNIIIIGATGIREDHTLANIGLLTEYAPKFKNIYIISPYGVFTTHTGKNSVKTIPGQQISFFAIQNDTQITAAELKWPLDDFVLKNWYCGTLNEATATNLDINSTDIIIIYRSFDDIKPEDH